MADHYRFIEETLTVPGLTDDVQYNPGGMIDREIVEELAVPDLNHVQWVAGADVIPSPIEFGLDAPQLIFDLDPCIPVVTADYKLLEDRISDERRRPYISSRKYLFWATAENEPVGASRAFIWDFDDGSETESGESVVHIFPGPGHYDATLFWTYIVGFITISGSTVFPFDIPADERVNLYVAVVGIKYVPAGDNFDDAPFKSVLNEDISLDCNPIIAQLFISTSPAPKRRMRVGRDISFRAVLGEAIFLDYAAQHDAGQYEPLVLNQEVGETAAYDVRIAVLDDAGDVKFIDLMSMRFTNHAVHPIRHQAFEPLFVEMVGTPDTQIIREF